MSVRWVHFAAGNSRLLLNAPSIDRLRRILLIPSVDNRCDIKALEAEF
jgi:hypothetical protein